MNVPPITLRLVKGAPLTAVEGDNNFKTLRNAINALFRLFGVSLNDDGTLKNPPVVWGVSSNGTDSYTITPTPAVTSMASLLGRLVAVKADVATTGPATLNISGLGAQAILKNKNQALETNDIKAGQVAILSWDGTNFQMQSQPGVNQPLPYAQDTGASANTIVVAADASGTVQFPAALVAGYSIKVKVINAVTGATTLQIGALSAKAVKKNVSEDLATGDILVNQVVDFVYDGTNFQLLSAPNYGATFATALAAQNIAGSGSTPNYQTLSFAHSIGAIPSYVCVVLKNITPEWGYLAGEEVPIHSTGWGISRVGVSASSSAIKVTFSANNPNTYTILDRLVDQDSPITLANWQVKVYVRK